MKLFKTLSLQDGQPLVAVAEQNVQFQLLNLGQMLHIDEVEERHVGRYSCLAENLPGRAEKDIVVSLLSERYLKQLVSIKSHSEAPTMLESELTMEVAENEAQSLECPLVDPTDQSLQFEWSKNGLPLGPSHSHFQVPILVGRCKIC